MVVPRPGIERNPVAAGGAAPLFLELPRFHAEFAAFASYLGKLSLLSAGRAKIRSRGGSEPHSGSAGAGFARGIRNAGLKLTESAAERSGERQHSHLRSSALRNPGHSAPRGLAPPPHENHGRDQPQKQECEVQNSAIRGSGRAGLP